MTKFCFIGDFHTHTCVSQHAYSTIDELVQQSRHLGFSALAVTDHGPEMMDGAILHHFLCLDSLPDHVDGLRLYKGAEVNIKDFDGRLDIPAEILRKLDLVIASYHIEAIEPGTREENTRGWIRAIESGLVDCLGHSGNPVFDFNHEEVVQCCADHGVAIEVNSHSSAVRPGSDSNCLEILRFAQEKKVPLIVNSDAHCKWTVGCFDSAIRLLEEADVREDAILNTSIQRMDSFIRMRKDRRVSAT